MEATVGVLSFLFASWGHRSYTSIFLLKQLPVSPRDDHDLYDKILSLPKDKRDRSTSSLVTRLFLIPIKSRLGLTNSASSFEAPIIAPGSHHGLHHQS